MSGVHNSIYALSPINKTAALVTGQAGCSEELSADQKRQTLLDRQIYLNLILAEFNKAGVKKSDQRRKDIGLELFDVCSQLHKIKNEIKMKPRHRDISPFFLLVSKKNMTKFQYDNFFKEAIALAEKYDWNTDNMKGNL